MALTIQDLLKHSAGIAVNTNSAEDPTQTSEMKAKELKSKLESALANCEALKPFTRRPGRDECGIEGNGHPHIQVAYDVPCGTKYATEAVFNLRDSEFCCYVRTWYFPKGYDPAAEKYELAKNGALDDDVEGESFEELTNSVLREAIGHRLNLAEDIGIIFSKEAREALKINELKTIVV
jgi:hypothetical protein